MTKTIVIANQKGGIGKTTTATALASILKDKGYNTLLIDADLQGNSTDTYRGKIEGECTLYDIILEDDNNRVSIKDAVQHTEAGDLIASDPLLRRADSILDSDRANGMFRLKDAIDEIKEEESGYDFIIIDTAPTINSILQNCLNAADEVIIPLTADRYGIQGLSDLYNTVNATKKRHNPNIRVAGLLLIKYKKRVNLDKEVKESLINISEQMHTKVFENTIRESKKAQEAQATRTTLINYDKNRKSTTLIDYINFTDELLKDMEG